MREAELERTLEKIRGDYDEVLREQRERIVQLRDENRVLAEKLEECRKRESQAGEVLALASCKAKEIESAAKLRYRTEIQRLREFHQRWVKYYDEVAHLTPKGDADRMQQMLRRMEGVFDGELLISEAEKENKREAACHSADSKGETLADGSFDLEEVLHPKNLPDLGTLCRELGLDCK